MALKRRKPIQRVGGLHRSELGRSAEKAREFLQRGRQPFERTGGLGRGGGMRRASAAEGPLTPAQWRQAVFDASGWRCILTGTRARSVDDRRFDPHHPLPKRVLRDRGLFHRVWDSRNGILVRADVHRRHEDAFERIPAEKLPLSVWEFCAELDAESGYEWATLAVLRVHPPTGSSRI